MGREATISWGGPELVFQNNWPAPLRMRFAVRATTITVRFESPARTRIDPWTGRPYRFRQPTIRVVHNPQPPCRCATCRAKRRPCWLHDRIRAACLPAQAPAQRRAVAGRLPTRGRSHRGRYSLMEPPETRVDLPDGVTVRGVRQRGAAGTRRRLRADRPLTLFSRELRQEGQLGF
jgi:hypothetical protein